jgi:cysteine-S-conjugate beta-lyase
MKYNFDEIINRKGSNSIKYDLLPAIFGTEDVLPMWVADMDFKTPPFIMEAIRKRIGHEMLGYTFRGEGFYSSIIDWMYQRHNWQVQKNWISFSPGVVPALAMIVQAFTRPGDKIVVQSPVYFPFFNTILDNGRQLIINQLSFNGKEYSINFNDLERQIDSRTKMLFLCSPHNPVGRVWKLPELEKLVEVCVKNHILIVSDEIHSDIILPGNKHIPLASISEAAAQNSISTFAPSKTFNLAGLSTSYLVIQNEQLKTVYDNYLFDLHLKNGNIFGDIALEAAYTFGQEWLGEMIAYISENTELVRNFASVHHDKMTLVEPEATYLLWINFNALKMSDKSLREFMVQQAKLGMNPGVQFGKGGEGFMRMNVACSTTIVEQALKQLKNAFGSL